MHDYENFRYVTKNGYIELSYHENMVLGFMIANKGKIVIPYTWVKKMIIKRLRTKLEGEVEIKTKYGAGYYID